MNHYDALYIGRSTKKVEFESADKKKPAKFYFVSYPAHKEYPSKHIKHSVATPVKLGSLKDSNSRTIHKYIHTEILQTCQLAMGLTILEKGSVRITSYNVCYTKLLRPLDDMIKKYNPEMLKDGFNKTPNGEEIFYISNPGLGLWSHKNRFTN